MPRFSRVFPSLYEPPINSQVRRDLAGGVAGVLVSVPQIMAYGAVAVAACGPQWTGIGILAGLYAGALAGLLAVVLGGNPLVVTGPRATTALVLGGLMGHLLELPGMAVPTAFAYAGLTVVAAGLLQVGFGVLRLGRLADFIPYPVVAGFLNGSALLILISQVGPLTGTRAGIAGGLDQIHLGTLALGLFSVVATLVAPVFVKKVPPMLVGVVAGTAAYHLVAALWGGGHLGGTVPGLPDAGTVGLAGPAALADAVVGTLDPAMLSLLLPVVLSMATLSSLDAVLGSVAVDQLTLHRSDTNRELVAQGLATALSGGLGLLPSSGSTARSAAVVRGGGRTALAPMICAALTLAVIVGLAPLVSLLPQAVMAGLLVMVGIELFDRWTLALIRRIRWRRLSSQTLGDLSAIAVVVAVTLAFDLVAAVGVGILVSLLFFVWRMARSPVRRGYRANALEARFQGDPRRLAFIERHGKAIAVLELEGSLFFGSAADVVRRVETLQADGVTHVVLDLKRVTDIDSTAARMIERLHATLAARGGRLALAYVEPERRRNRRRGAPAHGGAERRDRPGRRRLWNALDHAGSLAVLGRQQVYPDLESALEACEGHLADRLAAEGNLDEGGRISPAILRGLDRTALRRLRSYVTRCDFPAGELVFRQGDAPDSLYFVAAGRVEVTINLPRTDRKLRVQTLSRGAIFGEMAIIDPKPRSANVAAMESTVCYRLSAQAVVRLKREEPDFAFRLMENMAFIFADRVRASNVLVAELEG